MVNRILRCDWLPELARWRYFARSGMSAMSSKKIVFFFHILNPPNIASAVFVAFWLGLPFRERGQILHGLVNITVLYLRIFNTQNYILFNISTAGLFSQIVASIQCYKMY